MVKKYLDKIKDKSKKNKGKKTINKKTKKRVQKGHGRKTNALLKLGALGLLASGLYKGYNEIPENKAYKNMKKQLENKIIKFFDNKTGTKDVLTKQHLLEFVNGSSTEQLKEYTEYMNSIKQGKNTIFSTYALNPQFDRRKKGHHILSWEELATLYEIQQNQYIE